MADPLTTTIRLTQPTVGGDVGTWGTLLNSDMSYIDQAINQAVTVAIADTNVTLIADGSASDQARYAEYVFTGALTANRTVTLPANVKTGRAVNNTTGGHGVVLSAGGATATVPAVSGRFFFRVDETNNVSFPSVGFGGVTVNGTATLGGTSATPVASTTNGFTVNTDGTISTYSSFGPNLTIGNGTLGPPPGTAIAFIVVGGSQAGSITTQAGATSYNTTSDRRLKIDDGLIKGSGGIIDRLKPRWFRWLTNKEDAAQPGFFAQEIARIFPWGIVKGKGRPGSKDFKPWQSSATPWDALEIAELQSLRLRVAELEKKCTA